MEAATCGPRGYRSDRVAVDGELTRRESWRGAGDCRHREDLKKRGARERAPPAQRFSVWRKYSMVFAKPASSWVFGSHCSFSLAREISGRRCLGSSLGKGRRSIFDLEPVNFTTSSANC